MREQKAILSFPKTGDSIRPKRSKTTRCWTTPESAPQSCRQQRQLIDLGRLYIGTMDEGMPKSDWTRSSAISSRPGSPGSSARTKRL